MHSPHRNASAVSPPARTALGGRPVEDLAYQVVTLGAILLILGTVWAF